jgi:hypothetical protein
MAEYIEREAILDSLRESRKELQGIYQRLKLPVEKQLCSAEILTFQECIFRVKDAPTADVVPVVRCKDCKHYTNIDTYRNPPRLDFYWCNKFGTITKENDYCNYGERRCE